MNSEIGSSSEDDCSKRVYPGQRSPGLVVIEPCLREGILVDLLPRLVRRYHLTRSQLSPITFHDPSLGSTSLDVGIYRDMIEWENPLETPDYNPFSCPIPSPFLQRNTYDLLPGRLFGRPNQPFSTHVHGFVLDLPSFTRSCTRCKMATSRVKSRAPIPGFSSIFIVMVLCLLSIASVAARPHIPSDNFIDQDDPLALSRRDEPDCLRGDGIPWITHGAAGQGSSAGDGPVVHLRPDLQKKLATMTKDYPLATSPDKKPLIWKFSVDGKKKRLEIETHPYRNAKDAKILHAILKKDSRVHRILGGESVQVENISNETGLL